nr:metallophosphoesterase [Mesorhizobium sp.]
MRIAVLADIHGNVLALDAVLDDLGRRGGADLVVNLGDCVSGPLWPRETMQRLEALGLPTVRGNHDRRVAEDPADEKMWPSDRYAQERLTPAQREALFACRSRSRSRPVSSPSTPGPTTTKNTLPTRS